MNYRIVLPIGLLVFLIGSFFFVFVDVNNGGIYTEEDGLIENIGAAAFFIAAALFFYLFLESGRLATEVPFWGLKKNLFYLFLAMLFFVAFGEEISWGQRIFNWSTPESWGQSNLQKETNIHNLNLFKHRTSKGEGGQDLKAYFLVFSAGRIFFYIWFTLLVIIPVFNKFSDKWSQRFKLLNVPIAPLWIGFLMVSNLIISKSFGFFTRDYPISTYSSTDEIAETNYAILIAVLAIFWTIELMKSKLDRRRSVSTQRL